VDTALIALCKHVALWLNRQRHSPTLSYPHAEQHEEEQLVQNVFGMYFVEYYITLCYYAFWLQDLERLVLYMGSLMTLKQGISLFMEAGLPFLTMKVWPSLKRRVRRLPNLPGAHAKDSRRAEVLESVAQQVKLSTYDDEHNHSGMFDDFIHICFQFGYVSLFGAAYPLAAVYSLGNNLVEQRSDALKLLRLHRRPRARPALALGVWLQAFHFLSGLSILFNGGIIAFTNASTADKFSSLQEKMLVIFVIEHVLLALRRLIKVAMPEIPDKVCGHLAAQEKYDDILKKERLMGFKTRSSFPPAQDPVKKETSFVDTWHSLFDSMFTSFRESKED